MARHSKAWGIVAGACLVAMLGTSTAQPQFSAYVMPRFNPLGPANPLVAPTSASSPAAPSDPYYQTPYNPYSYGYNNYGPTGGAFMGIAEAYRGYGTLTMNLEQARSLREQSIQAKLETQRKRF